MRGAMLLSPILLALLCAPARAQAPTPPESDVERARSLVRRGTELLEQGKVVLALESFTRAGELDPYEADVPYQLARCECALAKRDRDPARYENARQLLRRAQSLDPRRGEVYYLWGVIGAETERFRDAKVGFEEALKRGIRVKESKVNLAQALFFYGIEQAEAGSPHAQVILTFSQAVDRLESIKDDLEYADGMRAACRELWIRALANLAAMRQRAKDLPEAEAILERLIRLEEKNHLHYYNLGQVYDGSKRGDEALELYRKSLELNPDETWVAPLLQMGIILSQREEVEEAEKLLLRYLEVQADSWDGNFHLAEHYSRAGKLEGAVAGYYRCLELDRRRFTAMYKLAQVLRRLKRPREADKWLDLYRTLEAVEKR